MRTVTIRSRKAAAARNAGVTLLADHARQDTPVAPRHCACFDCTSGRPHQTADHQVVSR